MSTQAQTCRLCGLQATLKESHLIPKFVFRWLKETSPAAIRHVEDINRRVQDGWKVPFLCGACEGRFASWESDFARDIFRPYHDRSRDAREALHYGDWCLPFCVSVSWRILAWSSESKMLPELTASQELLVCEALQTWREYLMGSRSNPGDFEQHIFPVDTVESGPSQIVSPFFNRYMLRAVQEDVIAGREDVLTFAKLGRILLFGVVVRPKHFRGWRINSRKGYIAPKTYLLPFRLGKYLREQADECAARFASMTDRQRNLADASSDLAVTSNAESWRAMKHDYILSGTDAVHITRQKRSDATGCATGNIGDRKPGT